MENTYQFSESAENMHANASKDDMRREFEETMKQDAMREIDADFDRAFYNPDDTDGDFAGEWLA